MWPIIPFLSAVGMTVSLCAAGWYRGLKKEEKDEADRAAAELAKGIYGKCAGAISQGVKRETALWPVDERQTRQHGRLA